MKRTAVGCLLVFLALSQTDCSTEQGTNKGTSKGNDQDKKRPAIPPTAGDSSPILVSDGSIVIHQKYSFRVHGEKLASIRLGGFAPETLGYLCDPEAGASGSCGATRCTSPEPTSACSVDLKNKSWTLDLFDSGGGGETVKLESNGRAKIKITANKGFKFKDGSSGGVDMIASSLNLQKAVLTVNGGTPFKLSCPSSTACIKVTYPCHVGCDSGADAGPDPN